MENYIKVITIIIAVIGAFIAFEQWRINKNKLRLDLYERRLNVYRSTINFIGTAVRDSNIEIEKIIEFRTATSEAEFLFDKEVREKLDIIYDNAIKLRYRSIKENDESALLFWFSNQYDEVTNIFRRYLSFKKIKN